MNQISKPIFVFFVIAIGIVLIVLLQEPHSVCESQTNQAKTNLAGWILPGKGKQMELAPKYLRLKEGCKVGNSPGACYEFFQVLRKVTHEFDAISLNCTAELAAVAEVRRALVEGMELLALLAWGEQPPESSASKLGWLESPDIALFCKLKEIFYRGFGEEDLSSLRNAVISKYPGEARILRGQECTNCDHLKKANEVLDFQSIWVKSLFSVRCEGYR